MPVEICPVCNGMEDAPATCRHCGTVMDNMGRTEDYKGPYSPYMDEESFLYNNRGLTGDNCCIHLYQCPNCSRWKHLPVHYTAF